jgi:predicted permease
MNWELFKAPIMAVVKVAGLMPGIPTYDNRFMFYFVVVVPFFPIYYYSESLSNCKEHSAILLFSYFVFYLICNIALAYIAKKIGKRWDKKEYQKLKPDQITFPFILVLLLNATLHFCFFCLLTKMVCA